MKTDSAKFDALFDHMDFDELQSRFGEDNARAILRTLEQFEGIGESEIRMLSCGDRMRNVMLTMRESSRYQTRH